MLVFYWLKKKEKSASSTCRLKLSALCDLLDIVLCKKQERAPAKRDHFQCWSASKTTLTVSLVAVLVYHMVGAKTFTSTNFQWTSNGQVPKYECWLQDSVLFHFCLDKSAVLYDFSHSTFIQDRTASTCCNKAYSCCFSVLLLFFLPSAGWVICIIVRLNKETTEMADKTIKPPATKQQKINEFNNALSICNKECLGRNIRTRK